MALPINPHNQPTMLVDASGVQEESVNKTATLVWDPIGLAWVKMTQPSGGGGSGGAVTVADGADTAQGATTDVAWTSGSGTVVSLLKKIAGGSTTAVTGNVNVVQPTGTNLHVVVDTMPTTPVTGTFYQATQPVSGTLTLGAGSAVIGHVIVDSAPTTAVTGTFWQATQPVSGTFYQATQPISGTVTANISGSIGNTSFIATQPTGTNLHVVVDTAPSTAVTNVGTFAVQSAQSGTWNIGSITTMPTTPVTGTFYQATQPVSVAATVATSEVPPTTVNHALVTVTTSGTRVQFASNTAKSIVVKALVGNTGTIYVGGSTVAASNGFPLAAGDTVSLDINNTNVVWIDASVNSQSVAWMLNN
jgi:hypothetical protein